MLRTISIILQIQLSKVQNQCNIKWKETPWSSSRSYKEDYMNEKIDQWIKEVKLLSQIAKIEPQCADINII